MATWKYTSLAVSTLDSGIDNSVTSLDVASGEGTKFPTAGDFWLHIHAAGSYGEIVKCTARSTDTLTVTRAQDGTSAASHSAGDLVELVITAATVDQMRSDIHQTGADASKSAEKAGNLYLPNDGFQLYRDTGSVFAPFGPLFPFTAPVSGDFAWINQGGATVTTTNGGIYLFGPATSGEQLRIRKKAAPSAPYTISIAILPAMVVTDYNKVGLVFRESGSGKLHVWGLQAGGNVVKLTSQKYTSETVYSATYVEKEYEHFGAITWLRIADNNTNRVCSFSADGVNWITFHSVSRTDHLTADEVGFFVNPYQTTYDVGMTLLSWKEA